MIEDKNQVVVEITEALREYDMQGMDDFHSFLHEVLDGMVDIYYVDIFDSAYFLWEQEYLEDLSGDNIVSILQWAQYEYYKDIAYEYMQEILDEVPIDLEEEE